MTEQRTETEGGADGGHAGRTSKINLGRRALLRTTTATAPTILTLASGAALARSSNLIGTMANKNTGDVLCLDPNSTQGALPTNPNVYDLGAPAYGEVTRFPLGNRYRKKIADSRDISPSEACHVNGELQVKYNYSGRWVDKNRRAGVIVSNAAVASFGSRIISTDI
jgi:hypothetical protein